MIYYHIYGVDEMFSSLRSAKKYVWQHYTQDERKKYLTGSSIVKIVNNEVVTITPIIVYEDGYTFAKTYKNN